ncbi:hypothetical protein GGR58DRAFT_526580 [Xylaria digitata]|nr:hypothetical protein GGR58DRAFT_526580 [Xylaria digitata]
MDEHRSQEDNQSSSGSNLPPNASPPVIQVDQGPQLHSPRILPSPQSSMASPQSQASATTNPGTQTPGSNNTAAAPGPGPATAPSGTSSVPISPQQPASSAPPGINPAALPPHQTHPTAAFPPQHPARPPTVPWGYPPYQFPNPSRGGPFNMATLNGCPQPFCYPPPHMQQQTQQQQIWYYYPGTTPGTGLPMTCTPKSPFWSGTAHYLTSPPPQAPQVYTVEPAYIMPQGSYYQAAAPSPASGPFYYGAGAPIYYFY